MRRPFPTDARTWAVLSVIGLGATSLGFMGMFHAAEFISPGLATVIANAQPLLAAVLAYAVLGEKLTRKGIAGLAVGFAGIVTMALPGIGSGPAGGYLLGVGYIGLAAAGLSVAHVAMKRLSGNIDPPMGGGLAGLLITLAALRSRYVTPQRGIPSARDETVDKEPAPGMPLLFAWLPYLLLVGLLVATRLEALPLRGWLEDVSFTWRGILQTGIDATLAPLYLPGTAFVVVVLITIPFHRMAVRQAGGALLEAAVATARAALPLIAAVAMVRIFIHSGVNDSGRASMPLELAMVAADGAGTFWPLVAPLVGAFGAFLSGSATFSNLMFALLQVAVAERTGAPADVVLAAQMLGSNAGNMVSVLNVVAAAAVVGLIGREGDIIRFTLSPMLAYCAVAGLLALGLAGAW